MKRTSTLDFSGGQNCKTVEMLNVLHLCKVRIFCCAYIYQQKIRKHNYPICFYYYLFSIYCASAAYRATGRSPGLKMYRKEKPLTLKSSASSLTNNLTVFISPEKGSMNYAVVHKSVVNVISSSLDGSTVTNRQVICKEPSVVQQNTPMIIQAWIYFCRFLWSFPILNKLIKK